MRIPLPYGITDEQLTSASLRLKKKSGDTPSLQAVAVTKHWDRTMVTWDELEGSYMNHVSKEMEAQDDDWYSIDVTEIIKNWLSGECGQYGVMLEETELGKETSFSSSYEGGDNCPELILNYMKSDEVITNYTYEEQENGTAYPLLFGIRIRSSLQIYN